MEKVKSKGSSRENAHLRFERDHYAAYGFSWPQRNYKCTFCTKEFKSAQALGGHMNVHRRDRARLRQCSPSSWDLHSPNPNPNPNFSSSTISSSSISSTTSSTSTVRFVPYPTSLIYQHSLISSSSRDEERPIIAQHSGRDYVGPQLGDIRKKLGMVEMGELKGGFVQENGAWRKRDHEIVMMGMELELGLVGDAKVGLGLDLELRLGQSNLM